MEDRALQAVCGGQGGGSSSLEKVNGVWFSTQFPEIHG